MPGKKLVQKAEKIFAALKKRYPRVSTALKHKTPLQLLVSTILSAQCTDERVNKVTPQLFRKYRGARAFAGAKRSELENEIRSTGFYRNKAKSIIGTAKKIVSDFGGKVPDNMEELLLLPGVARKTANVVLGSAFGKNEGIAVDTHVWRISNRLGLSNERKNRDRVERDLMELFPQEDWDKASLMIIKYGREICRARKPLCGECTITEYCTYENKTI